MLGYEPKDTTTLDKEKMKQPVELGMNLKQVQEIFPAPDKFEYDPLTNKKVTILTRDAGGEHFTFFFTRINYTKSLLQEVGKILLYNMLKII